MKDAYLIEILTQILYYPFEYGLVKAGKFKDAPLDLIRIF